MSILRAVRNGTFPWLVEQAGRLGLTTLNFTVIVAPQSQRDYVLQPRVGPQRAYLGTGPQRIEPQRGSAKGRSRAQPTLGLDSLLGRFPG